MHDGLVVRAAYDVMYDTSSLPGVHLRVGELRSGARGVVVRLVTSPAEDSGQS